jgi:hypothetical protein
MIYRVMRDNGRSLVCHTAADYPAGACLRAKLWGEAGTDEELTAEPVPVEYLEDAARSRIRREPTLAPHEADMFDALDKLNRINAQDHVRWFLTGSVAALTEWAADDAKILAERNRGNGTA